MTGIHKLFISLAIICPAAWAQVASSTSGTISSDLRRGYDGVKANIKSSAERMPEDGYAYKPMPDVRSFAEVMLHVAMAQSRVCGAITGADQKSMGDTHPGMAKADVMSALNSAFAACDQAYAGLTDANALEAVKTPRGTMTRAGILAGNTAHDSEQYGIIAMYLRSKGLTPPSSDKK